MSAVIDPRPVGPALADRAAVDWDWHRWMARELGADLDPALTAERLYAPSLEPLRRDWRDGLIVWAFVTGLVVWALLPLALGLAVVLAALGRLP